MEIYHRHWERHCQLEPTDIVAIDELRLNVADAARYAEVSAAKKLQGHVAMEYDASKAPRPSQAIYRAQGNGVRRGGFPVSRDY